MKLIQINACVNCGNPAEGNYSINRDDFCEGPQIPLCDNCGKDPEPSCSEIWDNISLIGLEPARAA